MENFYPELLILILGGIGFFTYKHPKESRLINSILAAVVGVILIGMQTYNHGSMRAYHKSQMAIIEKGGENRAAIQLQIESLRKEQEKIGNKIDLWYIGLIVGFNSMLALSFVFEKIHNKTRNQNSSGAAPSSD